jgi:mono/diheme cytochrome c family protein
MVRLTKGKSRWMVLSAAGVAAAVAFSIAAVTAPTPVRAADAPNPEGVKLFEAKIRPILAEHCVSCHGPDKQKGKLRLDTREGLIKGGLEDEKQIVVVVPGDPAKSMIIEAIGYKNEDMAMPPPKKNKETGKVEDKKLSDEQIKDMTEWVKLGAPYGEKPVESTKKDDAK